jgi:membrane protease YdiL (CAAX protease family)
MRGRRALLAIEYALLFVALPVGYVLLDPRLPLLPALWLLAAICLGMLLADRGFDRRRLWNAEHLGRHSRRALLPFLLLAPLLLLFTLLVDPDRLFAFVRQRPLLWSVVMLLYPLLSVLPQGIIYRVFVVHRYGELFTSRRSLIVASAVAFALVHLIFRNPIAPPLSFVGGLLFASTYLRTGSALVAAIQHAAFGCWVFTTGLGWYFYHGAAGSP